MMPPEKAAELGEAMAAALAAAVKANPNDNVAVHRALWKMQIGLTAELKATLRRVRDQIEIKQDDGRDTLALRVMLQDINRALSQ